MRYPLSNLTWDERLIVNVLQGKIYRLIDKNNGGGGGLYIIMEWEELSVVLRAPEWKMYNGNCIQQWHKGGWKDYLPYRDSRLDD